MSRQHVPSFLEPAVTRAPWETLPGEFYSCPSIYDAELEAIWRTGWLFVGHTCELSTPGDYLTVDIGPDSIVIVRTESGGVRGYHNVCRHRGTLLCLSSTGHARRFVCPYHQWSYDINDGHLAACRGMGTEFDRTPYGLIPVAVKNVSGLIFASLADQQIDFSPAETEIGSVAAAQGLERARIAKIVDYCVDANWKLIWENNRECYHCNANHPQYIKANYDHFNADDTTPEIGQRIADAVATSEAKWQSLGLAASHRQTGMAPFPDIETDRWFAANRTVLSDGYVSETMDGKQKAPLMGDYAAPDVGTLRIRTMPNMWNHSSCDHAVTTRLLPISPTQTGIRVYWLVDEHAVEGEDYRLDDIMPFWQLTSEQDWELCERVQRGVASSGYRVGTLSQAKEYNVEAYFQWYCQQVVREPGGKR